MVLTCMSSALRVVSSHTTIKNASQKMASRDRHCADFPPSAWGEYFIRYSNNGLVCSRTQKEIQELKVGVKKYRESVLNNPSQHLNLIDAIDRLGLGYHFEEEIEESVASMFEKSRTIICGYDMYDTSLHFRLLRKHGYNLPSDIFNKFVDSDGFIIEELRGDIRGLLGLYEAAQLRVHDDVILDQALNATIRILESSSLSKKDLEVQKALKVPFHKDIRRLSTRRYIASYGDQSKSSHEANLLKMAKLDFNLLQHQYQYELSQLSIWWKELGLASNCPFARDRVVELYVWSVAILFEPQYNVARTLFTKVFSILTVLDDIYDAYGKADELELLTEAITRWDRSSIQQMPTFMKATYQALLDVFEEIEGCIIAPHEKSYRTQYVQKAVKMLSKAYLDEYRWFKNSHVPKMEEYMQVGLVTSGVPILAVGAMVGMGDDDITEESFEWVFKNPKMLTACSIFCRLKDDIVSHKFEQERGHSPSAVECYMKQYEVSEQEAYKEFSKQVTSAWKDMNECYLKPTPVPYKVFDIMLNIARIVEVFYTDGDGLTHAQELMKNEVNALLVNPILI